MAKLRNPESGSGSDDERLAGWGGPIASRTFAIKGSRLMISFSFSIKVINIPDLDRHQIEVKCPVCMLHTWVKLGEIRRRDFVICRGCHANILLEDYLGSVHRSVRSFEQMLKGLER
ncbi:MAG: hypothetical protein ABSC73_09515 [Acidimicrobiales bacterium]|jgi:hypothetical protein